MSYLGEVETAVNTIFNAGNRKLALFHCTSNYPTAPQNVNLRAMQTLISAFGLPVGYSDHTEGIEISLAAVALGACMIEKHFTLDRSLPGPDHRTSLEPKELEALVVGIRKVEASLGSSQKAPDFSELNTALAARKSLVAAIDIPANTTLTEALIAIKRPGDGLPPAMRPFLVGRTTRIDIKVWRTYKTGRSLMRKIGVVSVSRSDYGIYFPILKAILQEPELELCLIVSGTHLVSRFGNTIAAIKADGFSIAERVEVLMASDSPEGIAKSMGLGIIGLADAYSRQKPDIILVLGDRFEMHSAALAALPFKIPVAHIHGGEETLGAFDNSLRHSITKLSYIHFASTQEHAKRLISAWRGTLASDCFRSSRIRQLTDDFIT